MTRNPNTSCVVCLKPIYRRPYQLKNGKNVYCSSKCFGTRTLSENVRGRAVGSDGKFCKSCGITGSEHFYGSVQGYECKKCFGKRMLERQRSNKVRAVNYLGGACVYCGYNKYVGALDFHHRDPNEKDQNAANMVQWSWERQKKELDKCILVCANCHREVHGEVAEW